MAEIRAAIVAGEFAAYHARRRIELAARDPEHPPGRHPRVKRRRAGGGDRGGRPAPG